MDEIFFNSIETLPSATGRVAFHSDSPEVLKEDVDLVLSLLTKRSHRNRIDMPTVQCGDLFWNESHYRNYFITLNPN